MSGLPSPSVVPLELYKPTIDQLCNAVDTRYGLRLWVWVAVPHREVGGSVDMGGESG